jgi:hypothetical protein
MGRLGLVLALLIGLSACYAGAGIDDNRQIPAAVASNATESAAAQAAIGASLPPSD